jgi:hypothetical protein
MSADYAVRNRRHHTHGSLIFRFYSNGSCSRWHRFLLAPSVPLIHYAVDHAQEFRPGACLDDLASSRWRSRHRRFLPSCGIAMTRHHAVLESVICGKPTLICIAPLTVCRTVLTHRAAAASARERRTCSSAQHCRRHQHPSKLRRRAIRSPHHVRHERRLLRLSAPPLRPRSSPSASPPRARCSTPVSCPASSVPFAAISSRRSSAFRPSASR